MCRAFRESQLCLTAVTWYVSGRSGKGDWKDTAKGLGVVRVYPGEGQTLEGEQGPVCSLLLSSPPVFLPAFGEWGGGMGTSVFCQVYCDWLFYCCFKIFYFIVTVRFYFSVRFVTVPPHPF